MELQKRSTQRMVYS